MGVSDVNEVIQKIVSQESTTDNLMMLTRENQTKIELLNEEKAALKARVEEIKYSGPGGGHRRKMVDDHEENLSSSAAKLERCRLKYERLAKMLISVKAGIKHLQDKLESVRGELGVRSMELTDEAVVQVLLDNEKLMQQLLNRMKAAKANERGLLETVETTPDMDEEILNIGESSNAIEMLDDAVLQSRPHNQRIELPNEDDYDLENGIKDDGIPDVDEEELTRDKVKN